MTAGHRHLRHTLALATLVFLAPWPISHRLISADEPSTGYAPSVPDCQPATLHVLGDPRLRHWDHVRCVRFSPDGTILASGSTDRTVKLWDAETGREIQTLRGHSTVVASLSFSSDGELLASGSLDAAVNVWDVGTGRLLRTLGGSRLGKSVAAVCFHPGGKQLATARNDDTVNLWDAKTGKRLGTLQQADTARTLTFSPDGTLLVFVSDHEPVSVREVATGKVVRQIGTRGERLRSIHISPDGKTLATGGDRIGIWDMATGRSLRTFPDEATAPARFSPDGKTLATAGSDYTIALWDLATGLKQRTLDGHRGPVYSLCFSPDGKKLASGGRDQTIQLWDLSKGEAHSAAPRCSPWARCVSFSPDGKTLAVGSGENHGTDWAAPLLHGTITLWDTRTAHKQRDFANDTSGIKCLSFSPDGKTIASGNWEGTVQVRGVGDGRETVAVTGHQRPVMSLNFRPDGKMLVTAGMDRTIKLWNLTDGSLAKALTGHDAWVSCVRFSPDGKTIASASGGARSTLKLWDVQTGQESYSHTGRRSTIYSVTFAPDGKTLATSSLDGTIRFWDVSTREQARPLRAAGNQISSIAFTPDGERLFSSQLGDIRQWDVASGKEIGRLTLDTPTAWVYDLAVSPDGSLLATANKNGTALLMSTTWQRRTPRRQVEQP
jgi:WD40 repeat protein